MADRTVTERRTAPRMGDGDGDVVYRNADVAVYDRVEAPTRPIDRVRWGAILAGLVTALSTLVLLSVLGLAVGLSAYDPGDQLGNFGMGASIWGIISTITAFILGGWVSARSAAVGGRSNALLNGIMVWAVTIPLILYMLGSGVGSILNMATDAAAASAPALTDAVNPADASAAADTAQAQAQQVDPATVQAATENASESAWGTLVALLLGLAAAAIGGVLGKHDRMATQRTA